MIMKVLFAMILLMIVAAYGCATDDSPVLEQTTSDVVEIGDITVEDVEELLTPDVEVSLDDADTASTVEEDVEN
jgi:hypothetical protein